MWTEHARTCFVFSRVSQREVFFKLALQAHSKAHMDEAVTRSSSSGRHPCSLPIAERLQAFRGAVAEAVDVVVVIDVSLAVLEAVHEHTEVRVHVLLVGGGLC